MRVQVIYDLFDEDAGTNAPVTRDQLTLLDVEPTELIQADDDTIAIYDFADGVSFEDVETALERTDWCFIAASTMEDPETAPAGP